MKPEKDINKIGLTKDSGYQAGARKTFSVSIEEAWDFLVSRRGVNLWLGTINPDEIKIRETFETAEAARGKWTVFAPYSHLRMKWQPAGWQHNSTLQVRVIQSNEKTTISFHQEHLLNCEQREEMKAHWQQVLELFEKEFSC